MVKKIGVAGLALLLMVSPLGNTDKAYGNSGNQIPELQVESNPEDGVKVNWAVEMLEEDVLYRTGFEVGDELPSLNYGGTDKAGGTTGGQSFTLEDRAEGSRSLKVEDTYSNGQQVGNPNLDGTYNYGNFSRVIFSERKYMDGGVNMSVSFKARSVGGAGNVEVLGAGGNADFGIPIEGVYFTQNVKQGDTTVKVNDTSVFEVEIANGKGLYISDRKIKYRPIQVVSVNKGNKTITVNKPFQGEFESGSNVLRHATINPIRFEKKELVEGGGWKLYNANGYLENNPYYNVKDNGIALTLHNTAEGIMYIDDLKMGYATKVELKRDGNHVYEGYLSEYDDKSAKDAAAPNIIEKVSVEEDNGKLYVTVQEPDDNGTDYTYTANSVSRSGERSGENTQTVEVKSGVEGYAYVIDGNEETDPGTEKVVNTGERLEIPLNIEGKRYLHIRAIDKAGNASELAHIELPEGEVDVQLPSEDEEVLEGAEIDGESSTYAVDVAGDIVVDSKEVGWRLDVSASQLAISEGRLKGYALPSGTIKLDPIQSVEGRGTLPVSRLMESTPIDAGESVTVVSAGTGEGIGKYTVKFPKGAIKLEVSPTTAKVDTETFPDSPTPYSTTVTWTIVKGL